MLPRKFKCDQCGASYSPTPSEPPHLCHRCRMVALMDTLDEETLTLMRKEIRDGRVIQAVKVARERTTLDLHQLMQLADFLSDEERRNPSSYGEE